MPSFQTELLEVFNACGGNRWEPRFRENWGSKLPIEAWRGVVIAGNSDFGLTLDQLLTPSSLQSFKSLVFITKLTIAPTNPDHWGTCLKEASRADSLAPIGELTRLEHLEIKNCRCFEGNINDLANLDMLTHLSLNGCCEIQGDVNRLPKGLLKLDLRGTNNEAN